MKGLRFLVLIITLALCTGCASVQTKQNAAIAKGVYSERAAFQAGRFDLAERYNEQLTKLVPPPKAAPVVHSFTTSSGTTFAVLPASFQSTPTVAVDSPAFTIALGADKALQGRLNTDSKALAAFSKTTDAIVRAKDAEAAKYEAQKPSFLHNVLSWGLKLSPLFLIVGVVCLCVFCPASIPFLWAALRLFVHVIGAFFRALGRLIEELEAAIEKKGGPSG